MERFFEFLSTSPTPFHVVKNCKEFLLENGFIALKEDQKWSLEKGGKYFVEKDGNAMIAFRVDGTKNYKMVASHVDSPALKLKDNPMVERNGYVTLNVEPYGMSNFATLFDRPLKIAGRVFFETEEGIRETLYSSPYRITLPSLAIHQNREVNNGVPINFQTDLQPLFALQKTDFLSNVKQTPIAYDLFVVSDESPYFFGANDEFLASPRLDNLVGVYTSLQAIVEAEKGDGIKIVAFFDHEEVGSKSAQGADSVFFERVLHRIALAFQMTDEEYYTAVRRSILLSLDNAHAKHPNHPETSDPTNAPTPGNGIVIKTHAGKAYTTDGKAAAIFKRILKKADVPFQTFYNRADVKSGGTLGRYVVEKTGVLSVDVGCAQLAMHSACESIASKDVSLTKDALLAFFSASVKPTEEGFSVTIS